MSIFDFFKANHNNSRINNSYKNQPPKENDSDKNNEQFPNDLTLPCQFPYYLSKNAFDKICYKVAKTFPSIVNVKIYDACVICTVRSRSGITDWEFEYDFNNNGKFSKHYRYFKGNNQSSLPDAFFNRLTNAIDEYINQETKDWYEADCPNCNGKMVLKTNSDTFVCSECLYTLPQNAFSEDSGFMFYYCDYCESYLNLQKGFTPEKGTWRCTNCGRITGLELRD